MNLSAPVLICHESEDFRSLLREMLTRNGFFHILESHSTEECSSLLRSAESLQLLFIQASLLNENVSENLEGKNFLILVQAEDPSAMQLAARYGVGHLLSFPFSSQYLLEKIRSLS